MITYRATLDIARPIGHFLAQHSTDERARRATRTGRRALTVWAQAVLVLRWLRDATPVVRLATDTGISIATACRYLHEGLTVLAAQAEKLPDVLAARLVAGDTHLILDGTLIRATRLAGKVKKTKGRNAGQRVHRWYSGKHRHFGCNIKFLATPAGPRCGAPRYCPASTTTWPQPAPTASSGPCALPPPRGAHTGGQGLPRRRDRYPHADQSRPGHHPLHVDQQCHNMLHAGLRALGERAASLLKSR